MAKVIANPSVSDAAGMASAAGSSPASLRAGVGSSHPPRNFSPPLGGQSLSPIYPSSFSTRHTPQSEPIPGSNQVPNNAGGHAFAVDNWTRLDRFLVLGTENGSYYV